MAGGAVIVKEVSQREPVHWAVHTQTANGEIEISLHSPPFKHCTYEHRDILGVTTGAGVEAGMHEGWVVVI